MTTEASATWNGHLAAGDGTVHSRSLDEPHSIAPRFEGGDGLNPEELVGAALSSCYAMALAHGLAEEAKEECPVSKALSAVEISLADARLAEVG